jgi:Zn-finger nucleic acid-binding protein
MAYRDHAGPICPGCDVALESTQITREIDVNVQPQRALALLPQRPPMQLAPWTSYACSKCRGQFFEPDHLAALVDHAAGDVRRLDKRMSAIEPAKISCPRCPATMTTHALFGQRVDRCKGHGVWLAAGVLEAILAAATPIHDTTPRGPRRLSD